MITNICTYPKENDKKMDIHFFTEEMIQNDFDPYATFRTEDFALVIVLEGRIDLHVNLEKQVIYKNQAFLLPPYPVKRLESVSDDVKLIGVAFSSNFLIKLGMAEHKQDIFNLLTTVTVIDLTDEDAGRIIRYMDSIKMSAVELSNRTFSNELIQTNFLSVLYELASIGYAQNKITPQKATRKEAIAIQFGLLAMKHFKEKKQLNFYAKAIYVTPKYLTQVVKEITGKTAGELLDELIIQEAKILLENPNVSIGEVANALNFQDQSFFGKYFKRHVQLSPREFRSHLL